MESLWQDFRRGLRTWRRSPGLTLAALVALALGIGANVAIFSVVDAVLLRPLPFARPAELVVIWDNFLRLNMERLGPSPIEFLEYKERKSAFADVGAFDEVEYNLTEPIAGGEPERVVGGRVSANLFPLLGVAPATGRAFTAEDDRESAPRVALLSDDLWRKRYDADPGLVGRTIKLDGGAYEVIGVMPRGFKFPDEALPNAERADVWTPAAFTADELNSRGLYQLRVIGRLQPRVTLAQARAEMDVFAKQLEERHPHNYRGPKGADGGWKITVFPLYEEIIGDSRPTLLLLFGAVACVLLIACANVANLLLVSAAARRKEFAVRAALGASRARLVRQLLIESVLLSFAGGALGVLLAWWVIDLLGSLAANSLPRAGDVSLNWTVLAFAFAASLVTGLVFGVAPAWWASSRDRAGETLKEGGRGAGAGGGGGRLRAVLVVGEVATALVLLVGAGLLVKSFANLLRVEPGFEVANLLGADVTLSRSNYPTAKEQSAFYGRLIERLESSPGVRAVSVTSAMPLDRSAMEAPFSVRDRPYDPSKRPPIVRFQVVGQNYFRTTGISVAQGRDVTARDVSADASPTIFVNEELTRQFFAGEEVIGKEIKIGGPNAPGPWASVAGVVRNVKSNGLDLEVKPEVYLPYTMRPGATMTVAVRGGGQGVSSLINVVRKEVQAIDPAQPIYNVRTMGEALAEATAKKRFAVILFMCLGVIALLLAATGLYAVMSYAVTQRTHEIGVRTALGAKQSDVLRLIVGNGMALALVGLAVGTLLAFAATRLLTSLLFGVTATDSLTFGSASALLMVVALLACYIPARRAASVDPLVALRHE